jgi:hypothetical protein
MSDASSVAVPSIELVPSPLSPTVVVDDDEDEPEFVPASSSAPPPSSEQADVIRSDEASKTKGEDERCMVASVRRSQRARQSQNQPARSTRLTRLRAPKRK